MTCSELNVKLLVALGLSTESAELIEETVRREQQDNYVLRQQLNTQGNRIAGLENEIERLSNELEECQRMNQSNVDAAGVEIGELKIALGHYRNNPPPHPPLPPLTGLTLHEILSEIVSESEYYAHDRGGKFLEVWDRARTILSALPHPPPGGCDI